MEPSRRSQRPRLLPQPEASIRRICLIVSEPLASFTLQPCLLKWMSSASLTLWSILGLSCPLSIPGLLLWCHLRMISSSGSLSVPSLPTLTCISALQTLKWGYSVGSELHEVRTLRLWLAVGGLLLVPGLGHRCHQYLGH